MEQAASFSGLSDAKTYFHLLAPQPPEAERKRRIIGDWRGHKPRAPGHFLQKGGCLVVSQREGEREREREREKERERER